MNKKSNKGHILKRLGISVAVIVALFCIAFMIYKSEPQYVKNEKGENYLDENGNPSVYYKDLFGHTFYIENGRRLYCAVPVMIDTRPYDSNGHLITTEPTSTEAKSVEPSESVSN